MNIDDGFMALSHHECSQFYVWLIKQNSSEPVRQLSINDTNRQQPDTNYSRMFREP